MFLIKNVDTNNHSMIKKEYLYYLATLLKDNSFGDCGMYILFK